MSKSLLLPIVLFFGAVILGMFMYAYLFALEQSPAETAAESTLTSPTPTPTADRPDRSLRVAARASLPLPGSAPVTEVPHTVTLTEIRQGCFQQDCIPSVDEPIFVSVSDVQSLLAPEDLGIALGYQGEQRFYPFPMLETRELVNDVVAGDPLLISYCPLCGTGIVFDRTINDQVYEFGVSGMLWNSNLLMYNRAAELGDRNLWSQVLGEAVVGAQAGEKLTIVPSDIMTFAQWQNRYPGGQVLNTGSVADPYRGNYYAVASQFDPNFTTENSELAPDAYVYGITVGTIPLAIASRVVASSPAAVVVDDKAVQVTVSDTGAVTFTVDGVVVPDVEGFWFSYKAAYPDALLWRDATITEL